MSNKNMNSEIVLVCTECNFCEAGSQEGKLMDTIIMWHHMKDAHPRIAEQMTKHKITPKEPYKILPA